MKMKKRNRSLAVCTALTLTAGGLLPVSAAQSGACVRLEVLDADYLDKWSIDSGLHTGDQVFTDRTAERSAFREIPAALDGAELILTPCDAKAAAGDQAALTAVQDITLYVGLDQRVAQVPSWLSGWTKESAVITTTNDVTFVLYSTQLAAEESVTLGANGQSASCVNYTVIAAAGQQELPPAPGNGDVNADGTVSEADAILLQKWLAGEDVTLPDPGAGDVCADRALDVYDLSKLRRMVIRTKPHFVVREGLFDQSNSDTLSLSYPEGLETVTVWKADDSSDHYCNGVCMAAFQDKLYCMWQSSQTDEDSADTHVMYAVSEDAGRTWSEAKLLTSYPGDGYCTSAGWLATDSQLVAYLNYWPDSLSDPRGGLAYCMTSQDGESWSAPQPVMMADGTQMQGVFEQDPHVLATGRIVCAGHFQPGLIVSPIWTDDPTGLTGWHKGTFTATVNGSASREMEPSLFVQRDGTVAMIFRDQNSSYHKLVSYSYDCGETWTAVEETSMPDARTKQSAGNLSEGTVFLAGSPVNNSVRSPLAVTIAVNGRTFDRAFLLRSNSSDPALKYEGKAKRLGFHYTKSLVYNGSLYVGYATNKEAVEISIVPESSLIS